jgi:hypothetical protein
MSKTMLLTKKQILEAVLKTRDVPVPEWGGAVRITEISPAKLREIKAAGKGEKNGKGEKDGKDGEQDQSFGFRLMVASIVDEEGKSVFSMDDVPALESKSNAALKRVMDEISYLNAFTQDDRIKLGNGSEATLSAASTSV